MRHAGSCQISVEDHVRPGISVQPHNWDPILLGKPRRVGEQNVLGMRKEAVPFRFTDPAAGAFT